MGRINDKPSDGNITGAEKVLASDGDGSTVNLELPDLVGWIKTQFSNFKTPSSSTYDGLLVIGGQGNTDTTSVEAGDILIGINSTFTSGDFLFMVADINNPSSFADCTIKLNLQ